MVMYAGWWLWSPRLHIFQSSEHSLVCKSSFLPEPGIVVLLRDIGISGERILSSWREVTPAVMMLHLLTTVGKKEPE